MWSHGVTATAVCVTFAVVALAALPASADAGPGRGSAAQDGLMRALELAPRAVATWKRSHDGHAAKPSAAKPSAVKPDLSAGRPKRAKSGKNGKRRLDPFRIKVFAAP